MRPAAPTAPPGAAADDHADMAEREVDALAGADGAARGARSGRWWRRCRAAGRRGPRDRSSGPPTAPCTGAGLVGAGRNRSNNSRRGRIGQGCAVIRPVFERDEGARRGAVRGHGGERLRTWRWCGRDRAARRRFAAPPSGARPARATVGSRLLHSGAGRRARFVRISREMPGRGDQSRGPAPGRAGRRRPPSCRRGNSRRARAARRASSMQRQQDRFDMAGDGQGALVRLVAAPVDQQRRDALRREPAQQRSFGAEIEDVGRVDERGDEQDGRPARCRAIVAETGAVAAWRSPAWRASAGGARRFLIVAQTLQRHARIRSGSAAVSLRSISRNRGRGRGLCCGAAIFGARLVFCAFRGSGMAASAPGDRHGHHQEVRQSAAL